MPSAGFEPAIPATKWPQTYPYTARPPGSAAFLIVVAAYLTTFFRITDYTVWNERLIGER
jgi:hypothetical protein